MRFSEWFSIFRAEDGQEVFGHLVMAEDGKEEEEVVDQNTRWEILK